MHVCLRSCSGTLGGFLGVVLLTSLVGAPDARAELPRGLRAAYLGAVQSDASAEYAVSPDASGVSLHNPAQHLTAMLRTDGIQVSGTAHPFQLALALRSHGCADHPSATTPALPRARANRVEYDRPGLTEWYVNGPLGLEQGFTFTEPQRCDGAGGLRLDLQLGSTAQAALLPTLIDEEDGGQRIEVRDREGRLLLGYSDLYAYDATGRSLPARMAVVDHQVVLRIDDRDARYPVTVDPLVWAQQAKLVPGDQASSDLVGAAVAISGDTAVVGAPNKNQNGFFHSGAAYVFVRVGNQWSQQAKLYANDVTSSAVFGTSVAISSNTILVGAPSASSGAVTGGAAYVFTRSGTLWSQQIKLVASDAASGDLFGSAVGLSGTTAAIGAPKGKSATVNGCGALYLFSGSGAAWSTATKVNASDAVAADNYGAAVAVDTGVIVVGAPNHLTSTFSSAGQAYVVTYNGTTGTEIAKLAATDPASSDTFGKAVALSGTTAVVGAPGKSSGMGAAYVFTGNGNVYTFQQKITTADGTSGDGIGSAVAIATDTLALGCGQCTASTFRDGAVYVWTRTGTTWAQQTKLAVSVNNGAASNDSLGTAVAISGDTVVGGAPNHSENFTSSGIGYAFFRGSADGDPCSQPTQCAGGFCVNSLCRSGKTNGVSCAMGSECGSSFCSDGVCCNSDCGQSNTNDCQACSLTAGASANGVCTPLGAGRSCAAGAGECKTTFQCDGISLACPATTSQTDGQLCSVGVCMAGLCSPSAPPGYLPTPGAVAAGCELGASSSQAPLWGLVMTLGALGCLSGRRRRARRH